MSITPPIKWHGGKSYLADRIVDLMPAHVHYVEPFAGGLAVLLAKDPHGVSEVVNDMDGDLTNFWTAMAHPNLFEQVHRLALFTPFSQWHWENVEEEASEMVDKGICPEAARAYAFLVKVRLSMAGRRKSFAPLTRNRTRRAMNEQASAWLSAVEGLAEVHDRLKRVVVLNRSALDVIRQQDGPNTLFYLDPPYMHETRHTTKEYGAFEMTVDQHCDLLQLLGSIQGKFLLSGYDCELYEQYRSEHGWRRTDFELPNNAASGKTKRRMIESVWMNY